MKNSRCSGTLVVNRCSAEIVGAREVEQLQELIELVAADFAVDRAAVERAASASSDGPPIFVSSAPDTSSIESRICSAVSRRRLACQ